MEHTPGKCPCGHYHPTNPNNPCYPKANEIADVIQILDLSNAEFNDWQVIMRAMPVATFERKMDDER
jgi:hypothetical protein